MPESANKQTLRVKITDIKQGTRMRADLGNIDELADSIKSLGLIQPIVLNGNYELIAGGRRLAAHTQLGLEEIPAVFVECLNEFELRRLELEENVQRKDFDWKEKVIAVDAIHRLAISNNLDTKEHRRWTNAKTGEMLGIGHANVQYSIAFAALLRSGDKEINEAPSLREAFNIMALRRERAAAAKLTIVLQQPNRTANTKVAPGTPVESFFDVLPTAPTVGNVGGGSGGAVDSPRFDADDLPEEIAPRPEVICSLTCIHGDSIDIMESMKPGSVDHIITDPPFAIDPANISNNATIKESHQVEENLALVPRFLNRAYNILPSNGFCIFWTDQENWAVFKRAAEIAGFIVQRWPLVWSKLSNCKNDAAQYNWTKSHEIAMVCRKGLATIITPQPSSVFAAANDAGLDHPFAKPEALWTWILKAVTIPGQSVLDPFAGVGSFGLAAIRCGIRPVSIEKDSLHYTSLVANLATRTQLLTPGSTVRIVNQITK